MVETVPPSTGLGRDPRPDDGRSDAWMSRMRDRLRLRLFHTVPRDAGASSDERPPRRTPVAIDVPERIGRYEVLERIGSGGMGVIFAAFDSSLGRKVAVKLLNPSQSRSDTQGRARLLREAQALAKLSHPGIVQVYEVGTYDDQVFVAMEFVAGTTLRRWQSRAERPWRAVMAAYTAAGQGLAAAHRAGIVHRDFKPDNVLVRRDGAVRVIDFGLARTDDSVPLTDPERFDPTAVELSPLTRTGTLMGTPAYMAPEQFRGEATDARCDQFAFCVALYEALYGYRPFAGTNVHQLAATVLAGRIEAPPRFTDVPEHVFRVLSRGLSPKAEARYPGLDALLDDLPAEYPTAIRWVAAGFGVLAIVSAIAGWTWTDRSHNRHEALAQRIEAEFDARRDLEAEYRFRQAHQPGTAARRDALLLARSARAIDDEPTRTLAALKDLDPTDPDWLIPARLLAGEAHLRPIESRHLQARVDPIHHLVLTEHGDTLVYAGNGPEVYLHGRHDEEPRLLEGMKAPVQALAVAGNGQLVAAGDAKGRIRIWGPPDTDFHVAPHRAAVTALAVNGDGTLMASGAENGEIRFWAAGHETQAAKQHDGPVTHLVFSADGSMLASAGIDGEVHISYLERERRLDIPHRPGASIEHISFASAGHLDVLGDDGRIFRIETDELVASLLPEPRGIARIAYATSSEVAVAWYDDRTLRLEGTAGGPNARSLATMSIDRLAISGDGSLVAAAAPDGIIRTWRTPSEAQRRWELHDDVVLALANGSNAEHVAVGTASGAVRLWSPRTGKKRALGHLVGGVESLSFSPQGRYLAAIGGRKGISVWDLSTEDASFTFSRSANVVPPLRWSADGSMLSGQICKPDGSCSMVIHSVPERKRVLASPFGPQVQSIELSADGRYALAIRWGVPSQIEFHVPRSARPHRPPWPQDVPHDVVAHAIEPSGRVVRLATHDAGILRLWAWLPFDDVLVRLVERSAPRVLVDTSQKVMLLRGDDGDRLWPIETTWPIPIADLPRELEEFSVSDDRQVVLVRHHGQLEVIHAETGIARQFDLRPPVCWNELAEFVSLEGVSGVRLVEDPTPRTPQALLGWLTEMTDATFAWDPVP